MLVSVQYFAPVFPGLFFALVYLDDLPSVLILDDSYRLTHPIYNGMYDMAWATKGV